MTPRGLSISRIEQPKPSPVVEHLTAEELRSKVLQVVQSLPNSQMKTGRMARDLNTLTQDKLNLQIIQDFGANNSTTSKDGKKLRIKEMRQAVGGNF